MSVETHSLEKRSFPSSEKSGPIMLASLDEYIRKQKEEILSPDNMDSAKKKLGHIPTPDEAALYYSDYGGAKNFSERYTYPGREKH